MLYKKYWNALNCGNLPFIVNFYFSVQPDSLGFLLYFLLGLQPLVTWSCVLHILLIGGKGHHPCLDKDCRSGSFRVPKSSRELAVVSGDLQSRGKENQLRKNSAAIQEQVSSCWLKKNEVPPNLAVYFCFETPFVQHFSIDLFLPEGKLYYFGFP